jgi:RNA polymerase sigma-70 factor (ECF subfamily)
MAAGPEAALAEVEHLESDGRLAGYQYLPAVKADLLSRLGRTAEAAAAYPPGPGPDRERSRARLSHRPPGSVDVMKFR